jgi:hypothetical protein
MKRWLINLVTAVSLLLSLTAAAGWAMSYARPLDWRLLAMAHSPDLTRVNVEGTTGVVMRSVDASDARFGYWDGLWARSRSGRLTLLAHAVDHGGNLREISALPPSLIVVPSDPGRARAVAFGRMPDSRPWARRLGFAWDADAQAVPVRDGAGGPSVKAQMIMLPYWSIILPGLSLSLLWWRNNRRVRRGP